MSSDHPSPTDAPAPPGRHVLVADDEPLIREALRRTLEKRGHRVTCAPDAPTAIELLKGEAFEKDSLQNSGASVIVSGLSKG